MWQFDDYNAALSPLSLTKETLRAYVGTYGPRTITLDGNSLFYQREGQAKRKMISITDSCFALEGNDDFRLKFLKEGERTIAVEGHNPAGVTDKHLKNR